MKFEIENTNYPVKIQFDQEDGFYIAGFPDLPGCSAYGSTVDEAYQRSQTAKEEWLALAREQGLPIPAPTRADEYSGRILLRLPPSLHAALAERAKGQATSLNQYTVHLLSGAIVGDSVRTQMDQLRRVVSSLERQVDQLASAVAVSHSQVTRQIAGMVSSSAGASALPTIQPPGGSAYGAISGSIS